MLNLEHIKSCDFFKETHLKKWDILFKEWDIDSFLYIVYDWELIIEKSIILMEWKFKKLSLLGLWNIVWEWSLNNSDPKEVQIRANRDTVLYKINAQDFPKFTTKHPKTAYSILTTVISLSNTRLLRANREVTANYEVNIAISKISNISADSIYKLLFVFESILWVDQIMFFEKNLVMDNYYKLKYDSKSEHSLQNKIIKFPDNSVDKKTLEDEWIIVSKNIRSVELALWGTSYGFLVTWKDNKDFNENEEKLLQNTAGSFVAIIHQKKLLDEQNNKNYVKNI